MAGLIAAIHVFEVVDARNRSGHDVEWVRELFAI
jgi:hypothetical protein